MGKKQLTPNTSDLFAGKQVKSEKRLFTIRATASRLEKGLLTIPRKFSDLFPENRCQIHVLFDDDDKVETKTYLPCNEKVKECRIFGLSRWFSDKQVTPNDAITITIEGESKTIYRIALDRYMRQRQESNAREKLYTASTEELTSAAIDTLAQIAKRGRRKTALQEILQISQDSNWEARTRVTIASADRHEGVPPGLRVLLRELHEGKCQVCSFTFTKKDGNPYFEIHHIDPKLGHQPLNLLILCANCHSQFEHASISDLKLVKGWLVAVKINGKRFAVRQPVIQGSEHDTTSYLGAILLALQMGQLAGFRWPS